MAEALAELGVDVIEAGFPIASKGDWAAVNVVAREVRGPIVAGLARCNRKDIETAWSALPDAARPRLHVFLATSAIHREYKAVHTLPYVIVSQIRRTSDAVIVSVEAVMLWAAFYGAARFLQMPLPSHANTWVRLLIPTIVPVVALVMTDAYVDPQRRRHPVAESALAV